MRCVDMRFISKVLFTAGVLHCDRAEARGDHRLRRELPRLLHSPRCAPERRHLLLYSLGREFDAVPVSGPVWVADRRNDKRWDYRRMQRKYRACAVVEAARSVHYSHLGQYADQAVRELSVELWRGARRNICADG